MLKGLGDIAKMMQAAQDMQAKMATLQDELTRIVVTGQSGGGLVTARVTAKGQVCGLDINPSILIASEKEVVEDLIIAAIRDAQAQAETRQAQEMQRLAQGLGLPDGVKLPF